MAEDKNKMGLTSKFSSHKKELTELFELSEFPEAFPLLKKVAIFLIQFSNEGILS